MAALTRVAAFALALAAWAAPTNAAATPAGAPTSRSACSWSLVERSYPRMTYYVPNHWPPDEPPAPADAPPTKVKNVVLENDYVAIEVAVEAAGRVMHVRYKNQKDDWCELFNVLEKLAGGKTWDGGGWRSSFPYQEHGMRYTDQPVGWRVVEGADGSVTLAMDMRFARFAGGDGLARYGRFTDLRLGRTITLRPGDAFFEARMVVENPLPYRCGCRLWSTAQFRDQTDAIFVFPVSRMCNHRGADMSDWKIGEGWSVFSNWTRYNSFFSVNATYPFVGVYYPSKDANHMRIADPAAAPGAKLWGWTHPSAFYEIWTGMDRVFEQQGRFLAPFATGGFTERYWMARGIGQVQYANEHLAVGLRYQQKDGKTTAVVSFTPGHEVPAVEWALSTRRTPEGKMDDCCTVEPAGGPLRPGDVRTVQLEVPAPDWPVLLTVRQKNAGVLAEVTLPLEMPKRDPALEQRILQSISPPPDAPALWAQFCEMRDWIDWYVGRRSNASIRDGGVRWARQWTQQSPGDVAAHIQLGRVLQRVGKLDDAAAELAKAISLAASVTTMPASNPASAPATAPAQSAATAHHLLGLVLLEQGKSDDAQAHFAAAAAAPDGPPEARYMLALAAIGKGDIARAVTQLRELLAAEPQSFRPALLLAALLARQGRADEALTLARKLERADLASLEAAYVVTLCAPADRQAAEALERLLTNNPEAPEALAAFKLEIEKGIWTAPKRP